MAAAASVRLVCVMWRCLGTASYYALSSSPPIPALPDRKDGLHLDVIRSVGSHRVSCLLTLWRLWLVPLIQEQSLPSVHPTTAKTARPRMPRLQFVYPTLAFTHVVLFFFHSDAAMHADSCSSAAFCCL